MRLTLHLIFGNLLSVLLPVLAENLNSVPASSSSSRSTNLISKLISSPECSCEGNVTSNLLKNAEDMKHQIQNKTSILKKIKHRATHSNEAVWASISLSILLVLIMVGLLQSKMWTDQTFLSYPESQPVKFEQYNRKTEIKVKHLLKSQGRTLTGFFSRRKKNKTDPNSLQMESFLQTQPDQVDSRPSQHLLLSDSSDEASSCEDQDVEFSINPLSGLWQVSRVYRGSGDSRGRYGLVSTLETESNEISDFSNNTEEEPLINVG